MESNKRIYQQIVDKFATTLAKQFTIDNKNPDLDYVIAYCESARDGFLPKTRLKIDTIEAEVLKEYNTLEHPLGRVDPLHILMRNLFNAVTLALANRLSLESIIPLEDEPLSFDDNRVLRHIDLMFYTVKYSQDPKMLQAVEERYDDIRYAIRQVVMNIRESNYSLFYTDYSGHESKYNQQGLPYAVNNEYMYVSFELIQRHMIKYNEVIATFNKNRAAVLDQQLATTAYELLNARNISNVPNEAIFRREAFKPEAYVQLLVSYAIAHTNDNLKIILCQFYGKVIEKILEIKYPEEHARLMSAVAPLVQSYTDRIQPPIEVHYIIMYLNELKGLGVDIDIIYDIIMKDLEQCILTKVDEIKGNLQELKGYKVEAKYIIDNNNILSTTFDIK